MSKHSLFNMDSTQNSKNKSSPALTHMYITEMCRRCSSYPTRRWFGLWKKSRARIMCDSKIEFSSTPSGNWVSQMASQLLFLPEHVDLFYSSNTIFRCVNWKSFNFVSAILLNKEYLPYVCCCLHRCLRVFTFIGFICDRFSATAVIFATVHQSRMASIMICSWKEVEWVFYFIL